MNDKMSENQSFVDWRRQLERMRASFFDVMSKGDCAVDVNLNATPRDALFSLSSSPNIKSMAESTKAGGHGDQVDTENSVPLAAASSPSVLTHSVSTAGCDDTGHRPRHEIQQKFLWLDFCFASRPESLSGNVPQTQPCTGVTQTLGLISHTAVSSCETPIRPAEKPTTKWNGSLDSCDIQDNCLRHSENGSGMATTELSVGVVDTEEHFDTRDYITDDFVSCFFNNSEDITTCTVSTSSKCDKVNAFSSGFPYETLCTSFTSESDDYGVDDGVQYEPYPKRARFGRYNNHGSYFDSVVCSSKPRKRVTFGPNEVKYFNKREVIDVELYLERKESQSNRNSLRNKTRRKLAQVKTTMFGLTKRLRTFFTRSDQYVM